MVTKLKTFKEFLKENTFMQLSENGKFFKFFKYKDPFGMEGGIEKGADLVRKKGFDVIFNITFPIKVFAVPTKSNSWREDEKYSFYELTTGRKVLHDMTVSTAIIMFDDIKNKAGSLKSEYDKWLKERFEENEKYFGVKGKVN